MSLNKFVKVNVTTSFVKTCVSAIKILEGVVFIGAGSYLVVFDRSQEKIIQRVYVFEQSITGIEFYKNKLLIYGENSISLHELNETFQVSNLKVKKYVCDDWILSSKFLDENDEIVFVSMHSEAMVLNKNFAVVKRSKSTEICTCYCALIVQNENWRDLFVLSGTAFSQIFIWKPSIDSNRKSPILYTLRGHKGVIFSIDYSKELQMICSTSDDGKAIFWSAQDIFTSNQIGGVNNYKEISPIKEIQHRQRVFKCKFFKNTLVTALEDSTIKIWNCYSNYQLKSSVHQIGPIWSLDFCEKTNLIFSGGADGGVVATPLDFTSFRTQESQCEYLKRMRYKDFLLLNDKIGAGVTSNGNLNLINLKIDDEHKLVATHEDLQSYSVIGGSPCKNFICLVGMHGNIHLYRFKNNELHYELSCTIKNKPKIFSLHWLSCKTFLTCINNGVLILWYYNEKELFPIQFFELPITKERWSTSATYCGTNNILIGDRKGYLYLYDLERSYPVQVLKKVQPMGVTKLYYSHQNGKIIVLGRTSILQKYYFNDKKKEISLITKDKLPFSWLGAYHISNDKEIILGFSNDKFIVWNQTSRRNILEISCGGGHRLWDYHLDKTSFILVYQKVNKLTSIEFNLGNEVKNIIASFHGTETNCMKLIKLRTNPFSCVSISGGEDTTLRLCRYDFNDELNGFSTITTIKSHLSSIRAIAYNKLATKQDNLESYFIFSAGGRAQIILWKLLIIYNADKLIDVILNEKHSYYKNLDDKYESEIRIMDLTTIQINGETILFAACSNGDIRIYKTDQNHSEITHFHTIHHKQRCILKLSVLTFGEFKFLLTMATDGNITFLNITKFLISTIDVLLITTIKTNQSGINSFSFYHVNENKAVILTGGDDKAFTLTLVESKASEDSPTIIKLSSYTNENFHFAHITGVYITNNYFVTVSIDQKFIVYTWKIDNDNVFNVEVVYERFTSVTDLQGIDYVVNDGKIEIVLFGNGFEMFTLFVE